MNRSRTTHISQLRGTLLAGAAFLMACWSVAAAPAAPNLPTRGFLFKSAGLVGGPVNPPALQPNPGPLGEPVVKTVPWVASNPLIAHDTWSGKAVTLKGTSDVDGPLIEYSWDPGDGSLPYTGTVLNRFVIEATHTYTGPAGQTFTATLTVTDTLTGLSGSKKYFVRISPQALGVEVNVAIDEGLWALHKGQTRYSGAVEYGNWTSWSYWPALTPANVLAFEVNGHLETGSIDNPYTETVQRGVHELFEHLYSYPTVVQPLGDPDSNGNGLAIAANGGLDPYESGIFMDAIIAGGTPLALAATGEANVIGRAYKDIIQDMVDAYAMSQYDPGFGIEGGWRYDGGVGNVYYYPDNSACQWAAIGIIPAVRLWGATLPAWVLTSNQSWLLYSQDVNGVFGYDGPYPIFGPFATTPSGMVQLAMHSFGRGNPQWDLAETLMRDNFGNTGSYSETVKSFTYGMFAFVKSMLLHDLGNPGDGSSDPITLLQSATPGVPPIDWYGAQTPTYGGTDSTDGVARTILTKQQPDGTWIYTGSDSSWTSEDGPFFTGWSIVMLNRTLFEAGAPVAVAKASPNPAVAFQTISLDGSDSFHQDVTKSIVAWEWDLDNDGSFDDASGPFTTISFAAVGIYPVRLQVRDNNGVPAVGVSTLNVIVSTPPLAPSAVAGGPYSFCPGPNWFLNGSGSINPDDGEHEPGQPGDFITAYDWDLDGNGSYGDATGAQPNVTAYFAGLPGSHVIALRVTDNTSVSFPSSGQPNLLGFDSAVVNIRAIDDPACACVTTVVARGKIDRGVPYIQVAFAPQPGAHHYNVYRGTSSGGPYTKIGSVAPSSPTTVYTDKPVVLGTTYYYVVREANVVDEERCQSNQSSARVAAR